MPGPHPPLDEIDRTLVVLLQEDGRLPVNELARRAGIGRATAYTRLDGLRRRGVITGFRAEVDPRPPATPSPPTCSSTSSSSGGSTPGPALVDLPGLVHLSLTSGAHDAVLLVRCPDIEHCSATSCWCGCTRSPRSARPRPSSCSTRSHRRRWRRPGVALQPHLGPLGGGEGLDQELVELGPQAAHAGLQAVDVLAAGLELARRSSSTTGPRGRNAIA